MQTFFFYVLQNKSNVTRVNCIFHMAPSYISKVQETNVNIQYMTCKRYRNYAWHLVAIVGITILVPSWTFQVTATYLKDRWILRRVLDLKMNFNNFTKMICYRVDISSNCHWGIMSCYQYLQKLEYQGFLVINSFKPEKDICYLKSKIVGFVPCGKSLAHSILQESGKWFMYPAVFCCSFLLCVLWNKLFIVTSIYPSRFRV